MPTISIAVPLVTPLAVIRRQGQLRQRALNFNLLSQAPTDKEAFACRGYTRAMLATPPETIAAHIVSTPETLGGRPRIAGHRIAVAHVAAWRLRMGMSFEQIAATYDLPMAAVYAAMAYYYDHKAEIDARENEDDALADTMKAKSGSKLANKLANATTGQ